MQRSESEDKHIYLNKIGNIIAGGFSGGEVNIIIILV